MDGLFACCDSLISLPDISKWDTSKVENMKEIFYQSSLLTSLPDISNWNISNVKDIDGIFNEIIKIFT